MSPKRVRVLKPPLVPQSQNSGSKCRVLKPGKMNASQVTKTKMRALKANPLEKRFKRTIPLPKVVMLEDAHLDMNININKMAKTSGSVSSSSDSSSEPEMSGTRKRRLAGRAKYRRKHYVDLLMEGKGPGDLSLLERRAVGSATEKMYLKELRSFLDSTKPAVFNPDNPEQVDQCLVQHMNQQFLDGHQAFRGDRLIASFLHHYPQFSRVGVKRIPRALRALRGWRKLCPGRSRVPYPLAIWTGLASLMIGMGFSDMAIFTMIALSTYARPSELLKMKVFSLVRPVTGLTASWSVLICPEELGEPSKTGEFDVSVLLDSPYLSSWISKVLPVFKEQDPTQNLWQFNYSQYLSVFKKCASQLGLEVTPYHARHSGPSIDRVKHHRSQLEVQKRGQWKSTKSVHRYEKAARLARSWELVNQKAKDYCLSCESDFTGIVLGHKKPPSTTCLAGIPRAST